MSSSSQQISNADNYFGFLKNLNSESKLDLISKLSQSLNKENNSKDKPLQSHFGANKSNETAEEIITSIKGF